MVPIVLALAMTTIPATADSDDEFSAGDWNASGEASGITAAREGTLLLDITGLFTADFVFTIGIDGRVSDGTWDLDDGLTYWDLTTDETSARSILLHTASGTVGGTSRQLKAPAGTITSKGLVELPSFGEIPIDSVDTIKPFELTVSRLLCNDAWGEWVLSWNTQLTEASLSPTFVGNWHAMKTPPADEAEAREQLEKMIPEILELRQEMVLVWQQPQDSGVPIFPLNELWGLLERAVALVNEFNNLSRCERAFFGPDVIAEYVNALTNMVTLLTNVFLDNIGLRGDWLSGKALLSLVTMVGAVGAVGPGAVDQEAADLLEGRLRSEASRTRLSGTANDVDLVLIATAEAILGGSGE